MMAIKTATLSIAVIVATALVTMAAVLITSVIFLVFFVALLFNGDKHFGMDDLLSLVLGIEVAIHSQGRIS